MPLGEKGATGTQFPVAVNASKYVNATAETLGQAKKATIEAILERLPAAHRSEAKKLLADDSRNFAFSGSNDLEVARLLGELASIREAELGISNGAAQTETPAKSSVNEVRVLVALVPNLSSPDVQAIVIRKPDDRGQPLLLMRESDFSTTQLGRGLRAAALALERYGAAPSKEVRLEFKKLRRTQRTQEPSTQALVDFLKASAPQAIAGVGTVRANTIITSVSAGRAN